MFLIVPLAKAHLIQSIVVEEIGPVSMNQGTPKEPCQSKQDGREKRRMLTKRARSASYKQSLARQLPCMEQSCVGTKGASLLLRRGLLHCQVSA